MILVRSDFISALLDGLWKCYSKQRQFSLSCIMFVLPKLNDCVLICFVSLLGFYVLLLIQSQMKPLIHCLNLLSGHSDAIRIGGMPISPILSS